MSSHLPLGTQTARRGTARIAALALWLLATGARAQTAGLEQTVDVSIKPGPLGRALVELSTQAGIQIIATGQAVQGLLTPGVHGRMTLSAALTGLLRGTPLSFYLDGPRTVSVGAPRPPPLPRGGAPPKATAAQRDSALPADAAQGAGTQADTKNHQTGADKVKHRGFFSRIFAAFAVCSGAAMHSDPACAQDAAGTAAQSTQSGGSAATPASPNAAESLQEVVVTGTRFQTPNASSPAPITIVGASDLLHQGATKAEDLLNNLPQVNSGLTDAANAAGVAPLTGTATVDLRGIGAFRTLVLMNGRRINPGDALNPSADMHTIPEILIKRVEVLTGGASSIYGSDAEAGVVNFVMDTQFTGAKVVAQGSVFNGTNDNAGLRSIMRSSGVNAPSGSVFDGDSYNITGVYGTGFASDAGHVVAYAGYRHDGQILGSSRDFSSCRLQETGSSYSCLLDGTTPAGQFVPNGGAGNAYTLGAGGNTLRAFDPVADAYNPAPLQTLMRPDTRYNAGLFANYSFNEHAAAYLEAQFMNDHTTVQYEPSGTTATGAGLNNYAIPCNDPLLSPNEVDTLCTQNGLAATDTAQVAIGRRNIEAGLLTDSFRHTSSRLLLGLKGAINDAWTYDVNAQYGKVTSHERLTNDVSVANVANALDVVNVGGNPTCQSVVDSTDPNCIPYDIWRVGGVTPAAVGYITEGGAQDGYASHAIVDAEAVGDLGGYGLKSPLAASGIGLAVGVEYRNEVVNNQPSQSYLTGDLMTMGSARATRGSFHVAEGFAELKAPLMKNQPFAYSLNLDLSDRYANYTPQGGANAYNLGADWAPVREVRFRSSYSRAIRAPNGHELFLAQSQSLQPIADPCSGAAPVATQAQCARTGVGSGQYGSIPLASSVNVVTGGNPNLRPETADTVTLGTVFTNFDWAPSLLLSVDYWRIRISGYTGQVAASTSLANCLSSGNPVFCNLLFRDANGALHVLQTNANTGSYGESGIDIAGQYVWRLGVAGKLTFTFNGSALIDNPIQLNPSVDSFDCSGLYGPSCTGNGPTSPIPDWRHSLRTTWERGPIDVSLNWRHIGSMKFEGASQYSALNGETVYPIDSHVAAYEYFDLEGGYSFPNVDVHVGVNNLFDKKPPIVGYFSNPLLVNGNMLAGMYDTFGRELFLEITAHL